LIYTLIYSILTLIYFFLGVFQVAGKNKLSALNWYFFAICMVCAITTLNYSLIFYTALQEGVGLWESSYVSTIFNTILSSVKITAVPFLFSFFLKLSKIKSKGFKTVQFVMLSATAVTLVSIFIINAVFSNAMEILSSNLFTLLVLIVVIFSMCCFIFLLYKWMKNAELKRDRRQAFAISIGSLVALVSLVGLLANHDSREMELIPYIGLLALVLSCNHYANQYNRFTFNISNLASYVYTAVKLPVLILNDTGDIMLCNTASESFFKSPSEILTGQKLFSLFDFKDNLLSDNTFSEASFLRYRHKADIDMSEDAVVFNCDAVCRVEGQKCQISLNYVYDKFDEMICTVVIVNDITEKEELIRQLNESHAKIERFNKELQSEVDRQTESIRNLQKAIVYSMSDLIEKKDGYTGIHTRRVSEYVSVLLRELARRGHQFTEAEIQRIAESSLLHDMGKIAIPDSILLKNGKLNDDEFDVMKTHSAKGADSLERSMQFAKDNDFLKNAFLMAKHHHEKWNGGGYPDGKKENEIPLLARVIAIADVYDALRSERPYKAPFSREKAKSIILEGNGSQFDPELVDVFMAVEPEFNEICVSYPQNVIEM